MLPPWFTEAGSTDKFSVGAGGGAALTDTVTERRILPPAPSQVRPNWLVELIGPTDSLPWTDFDHDHALSAAQVSALALLQESIEKPPASTDVGSADRSSVGAGCDTMTTTVTLSVAVPPSLLHVME